MTSLLTALERSVAARWRDGLVRGSNHQRQHWRTKETYYRALIDCLTTGDARLGPQVIIDRAVPRGVQSTYYTVTGDKARYPLLDAYAGGEWSAIADEYQREQAHDRLTDETKVWSYWWSRTGWIVQLGEVTPFSHQVAAESLIRVLADWAIQRPVLAGALAAAPPLCAVEDLLIIQGAGSSASGAVKLLRRVVNYALSPLGGVSDGVLNAVRDDLHTDASPSSAPEDFLGRFAEAGHALVLEARTRPPAESARICSDAAGLAHDLIETLNRIAGSRDD